MVKKGQLLKASRRPRFLKCLEKYGTLGVAANHAGISTEIVRQWRIRDPHFDRECREAIERGLDCLESALIQRGLENDTTAAIFVLKNKRRDIYGAIKTEETGRRLLEIFREGMLLFLTKDQHEKFLLWHRSKVAELGEYRVIEADVSSVVATGEIPGGSSGTNGNGTHSH